MADSFTPLTDDSPMPFGKHQGAAMKSLTIQYLGWLWNKAGYGRFSELRGNPGAIADYIQRRTGWKWKYR